MSKITKLLYVVIAIAFLLPLTDLLLRFQSTVSFPFRLTQLEHYPMIGKYMPEILFWLSVVLGVLTILFIITIILWSSLKHELIFKKSKGKLQIQKKAIESFINENAKEDSFIKDPKSKIKITRHRLKIYLNGSFDPNIVLPSENQKFQEDLTHKLTKLLNAPREKIKITLKLNNLYKEEINHHRVE
ncbi:hypothetical protein ATX47_00320 [Oenococcus oeni]|uniref:alkaline shock response membrane anchor protein AmaP n=1 Tax=Oenococcus oeni TaxID=1247 RepID=UPI0008F82555|nr:alkaline shock response membrane anchor protein AmaP [Oenococcus oeni]OIL96774.1 hypothetical protein ATX47_00320 [Oenococcus oeni]